tara:strand:+ start:614 stop:718 length:105 start_codon:yes stop_codon:yes gene_type:complete
MQLYSSADKAVTTLPTSQIDLVAKAFDEKRDEFE